MTNEQLVQYIIAGRARGVSDVALRTELTNTGWREADISEAFRVVGGNVPPTQSDVGFIRRLPRGRIGRLRYFLGGICVGLVAFVPMFILVAIWGVAGYIGANDGPSAIGGVLNVFMPILLFISIFVVAIPLTIMNIMLQIRRLHDLNMSGWFILVNFVPFINMLFSLYVLFMPGTATVNTYGPPPSSDKKFFDDILNR